MTVEVELKYFEMITCAQAGCMRRIENIVKNNPQEHPKENPWQSDIEAAMAEYALAKVINEVWYGKGDPRGIDVGQENQVRHTLLPHGSLIVQKEKDKPTDIFWLVTGCDGKYKVHGWMQGAEAKQEKYWADPTGNWPAYFVPQSDLRSIADYRNRA